MKDNEILIIGGVGLLLFMAMQKKANAQQLAAQRAQAGGVRPGVNYATPTAQAGAISGAINGILNWLSGTPKTPPISGNVATPSGVITMDPNLGATDTNPVDYGIGNLYDQAYNKMLGGLNVGGNDGSTDGSNPQDGSQLQIGYGGLSNWWSNTTGSLE